MTYTPITLLVILIIFIVFSALAFKIIKNTDRKHRFTAIVISIFSLFVLLLLFVNLFASTLLIGSVDTTPDWEDDDSTYEEEEEEEEEDTYEDYSDTEEKQDCILDGKPVDPDSEKSRLFGSANCKELDEY